MKLKFNDTNFHEEHDWLVLDDSNRFVTGFATSGAATRFIDDAEREKQIDQCVSKAERGA